MVIHVFRDLNRGDIFSFSTDLSGRAPATAGTQWVFMEAIDTLKFPEPWDIADFQEVLDRLAADGFYLFQGELIQPAGKGRAKATDLARH